MVDKLISYWESQKIRLTVGVNKDTIKNFEQTKGINLPKEFFEYLQVVNGMELMYPNYTDTNGFLFYPLENLIFFEDEFCNFQDNLNPGLLGKKCLIFANYLQRSWWYGITADNSIVIIPNASEYKIVANSFFEFLELYINDLDTIYDY